MADIKPLKPLLYNSEKTDIKDVIMPPYDIIKDSELKNYYCRSEYNICRIDRGVEKEGDDESENKYTRAAGCMQKWINDKILVKAQEPGYYIYSQEYVMTDGTKREMVSFFAAVKIEEFEKKIILPHERTHSGPKEDRLKLMRATKSNTSPILSLYFDEGRKVDSIIRQHIKENEPVFDFKDDKEIRYRLWQFSIKEPADKITELFRGKQLFIADGHHRYETAMNYRNEKRKTEKSTGEKEYDFIMMCLISMEYSGMSILPTHRIMKRFPVKNIENNAEIRKYFDVEEMNKNINLKVKMLQEPGKKCVGVVFRDKSFILTLKEEEYGSRLDDKHIREYYLLDVCVLHNLIFGKILGIEEEEVFKNIQYTQDIDEAINEVEKSSAEAAFLLKASTAEEVKVISLNDEVMPQKSTYFLPKIATGMLINPLY